MAESATAAKRLPTTLAAPAPATASTAAATTTTRMPSGTQFLPAERLLHLRRPPPRLPLRWAPPRAPAAAM